jgi:hypothetical protein
VSTSFFYLAIKFEKPFLSLTREEEEEEDDVPLTKGGPKKDHTRKTLVTVGIFRGLVPVCVVNDYARGGRGSTVIGSDEKSKAKSHRFFLSIYLSSREMKSVFFFLLLSFHVV